ncbi:hypothetical protein [Solitalea lacus]|uniref:hypothetical protein n=1 Tax=Solitalea lacus TaxID=2911172 RepID=UPI001EDAB449|nr:hypothetical protein [Solitalea lacus]UKJ08590.1 hypothetical protein L2B55_05345 [Solitalea lacus]
MKKQLFIFLFFGFNSAFLHAQVKDTDLYYGISTGTWFATGGNCLLGNPVLLGINADIKLEKKLWGLNVDYLIFPKTQQPLYLQHNNEIIERNKASGAQITLEYDAQLLARQHYILTAGAALGYGNIIYYNPDVKTDITKHSVVIAPVLTMRFVRKRAFYQLKLQYNIANYNHSALQNVSLRGNALILKLCIGKGS